MPCSGCGYIQQGFSTKQVGGVSDSGKCSQYSMGVCSTEVEVWQMFADWHFKFTLSLSDNESILIGCTHVK